VYGNLDICSVSVSKELTEVFVDGKSTPFRVDKSKAVFKEKIVVRRAVRLIYKSST